MNGKSDHPLIQIVKYYELLTIMIFFLRIFSRSQLGLNNLISMLIILFVSPSIGIAQSLNEVRDLGIEIPSSDERPAGVIEIDAIFDGYPVTYIHDVVYANYGERELVLNIMLPSLDSVNPYPLVVFIQGSGWLPQNVYRSLPNFVNFARAGYVIASVEYRHSREAIAPAQVQDVKAAIRFMRANAERYGLDPSKVAVWGTSSGGHLAALVGASAGVGSFLTQDNLDQSSEVQAVIDFFGPTDFRRMDDYPSQINHSHASSPESLVVGGPIQTQAVAEIVAGYNPINYISSDRPLPPFLIVHGDIDELVPFNQSTLLYKELREAGKEVTFYRVNGAGHGSGIFSKQMMKIVKDFLDQHLR